jgi:putative tryptophan/tyrosine transport system substrate-binding protein
MTTCIGRRRFVATLGGAAAWPLVAQAQQDGRMRRVAVLAFREDPFVRAVLQEFGKLGWIEGRNVQLDVRFGGGDINRTRGYATELVKLAPDTIFAFGGVAIDAVQQETKTIPIIVVAGDLNERGTVKNIARPEGNITGFATFGSLGSKWLELLKEAAPNITRVAYLIRAENQVGDSYGRYAVEAAQKLDVRIETILVRNAADIKAAIERFAAEPNGALLPNPGMLGIAPLEFVRLAEQYRLPAIYMGSSFAADGGLMSYGSDEIIVRDVASYADRILHGAKISDLPVQYPTRFRLVVNLKTAKKIDLTIPESFLLRADKLIE